MPVKIVSFDTLTQNCKSDESTTQISEERSNQGLIKQMLHTNQI